MATYTVTTTSDTGADALVSGNLAQETADGGGLSLREAVILSNVNPGKDIVTFAPALNGATITLNGLQIGGTDELEIDGQLDGDAAPDITIDADQKSRHFVFTDSTTIDGLWLTNGRTVANNSPGGAIYALDDLAVQNSVILGNQTTGTGSQGGGVSVKSGNLTLLNSTVAGNSTMGYIASGGGIHVRGTATIINSTVGGNASHGQNSFGGGLFVTGSLSLKSSNVNANSTTGYGSSGGGIDGRTVTVTNSTVSGNSTTGNSSSGGGINGRTVTVTNSTVSGNSTTGSYSAGGGIASSGAITLTNSTISGNSTAGSASWGGGIFCLETITLTNSTVSGNVAADSEAQGGGLLSFDSINLTNSIAMGNNAGGANDEIAASGGLIRTGGNIIARDNSNIADIFQGNTDVGDTSAPAVFAATFNNGGKIAGVLGSNGGMVQTIALKNAATNPALDAGNNLLAFALATDARGTGFTRKHNLPSVANYGTGTVDLGAFELQPAPNAAGHIIGTFDRDTIPGTPGRDTIKGGGGDDRLSGKAGKDNLQGEVGEDTLQGGGGNDRLKGGPSGDMLAGDNGRDTLKGGAGRDTLEGAGGNDTLNGNSGRDKLEGGPGRDIQTGGSGRDSFIFRKAADSKPGKKADKLTDFNGSGEKINLKKIDAKTGSGNQAFDFIGTDPFSGKKGELRYDKLKNKTLIQADRDGDGKSDIQIVLNDPMNLQANDFVL